MSNTWSQHDKKNVNKLPRFYPSNRRIFERAFSLPLKIFILATRGPLRDPFYIKLVWRKMILQATLIPAHAHVCPLDTQLVDTDPRVQHSRQLHHFNIWLQTEIETEAMALNQIINILRGQFFKLNKNWRSYGSFKYLSYDYAIPLITKSLIH